MTGTDNRNRHDLERRLGSPVKLTWREGDSPLARIKASSGKGPRLLRIQGDEDWYSVTDVTDGPGAEFVVDGIRTEAPKGGTAPTVLAAELQQYAELMFGYLESAAREALKSRVERHIRTIPFQFDSQEDAERLRAAFEETVVPEMQKMFGDRVKTAADVVSDRESTSWQVQGLIRVLSV